jgi:hypothetical protein
VSTAETNAEVELSEPLGETGWVRVKEDHFSFTITAGEATLFGPDEANALSVGRAARALRKALPGLKVGVRLVLSVRSVVGTDADWNQLLERFNKILRLGLTRLGVDPGAIEELDEGGMPSEYRGFLRQVGDHAQGFLSALKLFPMARSEPSTAPEATQQDCGHLAEEIVFATRAVAFSMREGYATVPFTIAVALKALEDVHS